MMVSVARFKEVLQHKCDQLYGQPCHYQTDRLSLKLVEVIGETRIEGWNYSFSEVIAYICVHQATHVLRFMICKKTGATVAILEFESSVPPEDIVEEIWPEFTKAVHENDRHDFLITRDRCPYCNSHMYGE